MDKIALFINNYLSLGLKENNVYYHRIWYSDRKQENIRPEIRDINNLSLHAIFDLCHDFDDKPFSELRDIRNKITHRVIKIKMTYAPTNKNEYTVDELEEKTLQLARIVRNTIIYLLHFVEIEEMKKHDNSSGLYAPLHTIDVPDNMKNHR